LVDKRRKASAIAEQTFQGQSPDDDRKNELGIPRDDARALIEKSVAVAGGAG
jgi:hypothetical protein